MTKIHAAVEVNRGATIPHWAYRDVLFMLIDYSIRSFEVLERKLTRDEKEEVFRVFNQVGCRMGLQGLPSTLEAWQTVRLEQVNQNLQLSSYTKDLFSQYRKHLGLLRYRILLETQQLIVPQPVHTLLGFRKISLLKPLIVLYKITRRLRLDWLLKALILPTPYKTQIKALDHSSNFALA
ncbi:MAG: hypothetical protein RI909_1387 [Bacteroidota bacterium]|jgi:hypothetical protein